MHSNEKLHTEEELNIMSQLGIKFNGEKYNFKTYSYSELTDAVNYANKIKGNDGYLNSSSIHSKKIDKLNTNDEEIYAKVTKEFDSENKNENIWIKAVTLAEGDEKKAKYKYITFRVEQEKNKLSKNYNTTDNNLIEQNNGKVLIILVIMFIFIVLLAMLVINTDKIASAAPDCTKLTGGGTSCVYPDGRTTIRF